jgi:hypothetical protein
MQNSKKDKKFEGETREFHDFSEKSWYMKEGVIKAGDVFSDIMEGKFQTVEVKEILFGANVKTWQIVIAKDEKVYLFKTSKDLG